MATQKTRIPIERTENVEVAAQALAPVLERLDLHGEMLKHIVRKRCGVGTWRLGSEV